ncbi:helix-turn-helix domain-containing protein [Gimesia chilikensis]|uniref:Divergent AAA domain protein n=1 Tax=Gimesia chilikensis TaxID=2605989 RepID=A0A517PYF4_9PLAN|nr:ATP-binding protein [Gimesia chilikensis]QDT24415.1 Divergent AAA domain protein [Gimesia chilikensis]
MNDFTPDELKRLIETSGESDNIDFKGPMTWDKSTQSAKLAKVIVSFANSRDGGAIVIGRSEVNGQFEITGLTEDEAISFETTRVASWINSRFSPPVRLVCSSIEYECKRLEVISVAQFEDIPIICTKPLLDPTDSRKELLKQGTIYVRNQNAESAPLKTVEEFRTLIGLATSRQGDQMLSMFDSILKGKPILPVENHQERYEAELKRIEKGLEDVMKDRMVLGGWRLAIHPTTYVEDRWNDSEELEAVIQKRSIRIRSEFPPTRNGTHLREWGICNDYYGEIWTLTHSGMFALWQPYRENSYKYECQWRGLDGTPSIPDIEPGGWIEFKLNMDLVIEMFMFIDRFIEEYELGGDFDLSFVADSLSGRKLVCRDSQINFSHRDPEPCRANRFEIVKQFRIEEFRAEWESICADTIKRFFEYFPNSNITKEVILGWIERFKRREF